MKKILKITERQIAEITDRLNALRLSEITAELVASATDGRTDQLAEMYWYEAGNLLQGFAPLRADAQILNDICRISVKLGIIDDKDPINSVDSFDIIDAYLMGKGIIYSPLHDHNVQQLRRIKKRLRQKLWVLNNKKNKQAETAK